MNKNETLSFLNSLQRFGWQLGLDRISHLLDAMGNPQRAFRSVHIAGTNGKGSTCAMVESICRHAGVRTGRFISPHLMDIRERMCVGGTPIPQDILTRYISDYASILAQLECTYFEALTGIAFKYFADAAVDLAVVEVGLGGRFDATNLLTPELAIITSIALDHVEHLGHDVSQIAAEKAGIIKQGSICLSQSCLPEVVEILRQASSERTAELIVLNDIASIKQFSMLESYSLADMIVAGQPWENLRIGLAGRTQLSNALLAAAATHLLRSRGLGLNDDALYAGLAKVHWPGRLQKISESPTIVVDVAHNVQAIENLVADLTQLFQFQNALIVIGLLADKNWQHIVDIIAAFADLVWVVSPDSERALPASTLCQEFVERGTAVETAPSVHEALLAAKQAAGPRDLICVTGSHYLIGPLLQKRLPDHS